MIGKRNQDGRDFVEETLYFSNSRAEKAVTKVTRVQDQFDISYGISVTSIQENKVLMGVHYVYESILVLLSS